MFSIAIASFKEAVRKKIFILVSIITLIYLVLFAVITYFVVKEMNNDIGNQIYRIMGVAELVGIVGFYFSNMLVAFFSVITSVGVISSEIENGTIMSIISKPIKRVEYVLGKYFGLLVLLIGYATFLYISIFAVCLSLKLPIIDNLELNSIIKGYIFFILEPFAILSLSTFCGMYLKTIANGIIVAAIYILGLIGGIMEQIGALMSKDALIQVGIISSLISPFDVIYRKMVSSIFSSFGIGNPFFGQGGQMASTNPSKWMIIFIFIYIIGLLLLSIKKFRKKDIA